MLYFFIIILLILFYLFVNIVLMASEGGIDLKKRIIIFISVVVVIALVVTLAFVSDYKLQIVKVDNSSVSDSVVDDSSKADSEKSDNDNNQETVRTSDDSSKQTTEKIDLKDLELVVNKENSWGDSVKNVQVNVQIKNNSDEKYSDWEVTYTADDGVTVEQIWNSKQSQDKKVITFTAEQHNGIIDTRSSVDFGFILRGTSTIDAAKFKVTAGGKSADGSEKATDNTAAKKNDNDNKDVIVAANALKVPEKTTDDWLYTKGNKIVDKDGKEMWITGLNWFGYNTGTNTFDGLWAADLNSSLQAIADKGFNLIRVPISAELILQWKNGEAPQANFNNATNDYLVGMDSLQIFDYVVGQCRANGIKLMPDIHCADTDSMGHMKPVWYSDKISESDYIAALQWMADRYKDDDTIIAYDIKNEPHGKPDETPHAIWNDSKDSNNWKYIAEKTAKAILDKNPNVLIMVEGIEIYPKNIKTNGTYKSTDSGDYYFNWWGGNLRGVKDYPVDLGKYQNKLVYSPHDYGPTVFKQPWFEGKYTFDSLYKDCWHDNWMFIYEDKTAPLLIGEWGGFMREPNLTWMTDLRKLIKDNKINHTFWCFNSNSGDTGGLVLDDFKTWDQDKYEFVKEVLWQKNGKFVGLDHQIPLGKNGICLDDY